MIQESKNLSSSGVRGGGSVVRSIRSPSSRTKFDLLKLPMAMLSLMNNSLPDDVIAEDDVTSKGTLSGLCNPKLKSLPSKLLQNMNT